jgi:hypothetical protein
MKPVPQLKCMVGRVTKRANLAFRLNPLAVREISATARRYVTIGKSPISPPNPEIARISPINEAKTSAGGAKYLRFALFG